MENSRIARYSRAAAVEYATKYALKPNPNYKYFSLSNTGGDCSNFLSQCLGAGGGIMSSDWWYRHYSPPNTNYDTWAVSWAVAHSLYWYLKRNSGTNTSSIKGIEVSNVDLLELGDLIFYEDSGGRIFHSAIVTYKSNYEVLISQHSYEALNISYLKTWSAKKTHYMKITF